MRTQITNFLSLLLGIFLIVGCATSSEPVRVSYEAESNQTVYQTEQMRLSDLQLTSGLQKQNRYYVQVKGQCLGQDCAPSEYTVRFIKEGTQSVKLVGRDITLTVGTETITWSDPQTRERSQTATIRSGTFAEVDVSSGQLSTIGGVSKVRGTVGTAEFTIPYDNREPVRTLLSRVKQEASTDSDNSS